MSPRNIVLVTIKSYLPYCTVPLLAVVTGTAVSAGWVIFDIRRPDE